MGNALILLSAGGKRMPTKARGVDVKFASKFDFSAEALVAHPGLRPPPLPPPPYGTHFRYFQIKLVKTLSIGLKILTCESLMKSYMKNPVKLLEHIEFKG